ncbi:hypothetical protein RXV94_09500 [Yeosuana sp. MJ-SS3]|uniref:Uncharacterized protein n=1 Tax=Gilvirhabdus luticola TaxID=3079858 RepID=A0ABU3U7K9_9FLAO|nr:hypothetical protein [Yeosuana sp. MJ-SS3]MDU8886393.1 hypothetical protein [Yeosuana sp. MJ-SS3]
MKKIILINAIVWAALLLVGSYLFKDHENWNYFFMIIILGFITINSVLAVHNRKENKKCFKA